MEKHCPVHGYLGVCGEIFAVGLPGKLVVVMLERVTLFWTLLWVRCLPRAKGGMAVPLVIPLPLPVSPMKKNKARNIFK